MRAVVARAPVPITDSESLVDVELPDPEPPTGRDLLVEVHAVSVNPVDAKVRSRRSEGDDEQVLGWDAAGVVRAVGDDVAWFEPGDEVYYAGSIDRPGTNSELHLVDERVVGHAPTSLDMAEAAALPLTTITAWELLFDRLGLDEDSTGTLLVVGAGGGVGSMVVQLARTLTGMRVVATASRDVTRDWVRDLGAHDVVDHHGDLSAQLADLDIDAVEAIAALTHTGDHLDQFAEVIAPQGRIAVIDDPDELDIMPFKQKAVSWHWEFMFARPLHQTPDLDRQHHLLEEVARLVDAGSVRTTLADTRTPIDAVTLRDVHEFVESGAAHGKVVVSGWPD